jgi:hypothetical protein
MKSLHAPRDSDIGLFIFAVVHNMFPNILCRAVLAIVAQLKREYGKLLHQQQMRAQAYKHDTKYHFEEGEWVYLKLKLYVQKSIAKQGTHKLDFLYYGPFLILQKVNTTAYKLDLSTSNQIHLSINVS